MLAIIYRNQNIDLLTRLNIGVEVFFCFVFYICVFYAHQGCIYLSKDTVKSVKLKYYNLKLTLFYYKLKMNFQQPVLQSSLSHKDL